METFIRPDCAINAYIFLTPVVITNVHHVEQGWYRCIGAGCRICEINHNAKFKPRKAVTAVVFTDSRKVLSFRLPCREALDGLDLLTDESLLSRYEIKIFSRPGKFFGHSFLTPIRVDVGKERDDNFGLIEFPPRLHYVEPSDDIVKKATLESATYFLNS